MATKGIKLNDILQEFNSTMQKEAQEGEEVEAAVDDAVVDAAEDVVEANEERKASVDILKQVAEEAAEMEEDLIQKEASEFGRLFADSVYDELQKKAEEDEFVTKVAEETYSNLMLEDVSNEAYQLSELAHIEKQAYDESGGDIPEDVQQALLMNEDVDEDAIAEEAYAEAQAAMEEQEAVAQEAADEAFAETLDETGDEELAEQIAEEAYAEAQASLEEEPEDEEAFAQEVASEAYAEAMEALGGDEELSEQVAAEAYEIVKNSMEAE